LRNSEGGVWDRGHLPSAQWLYLQVVQWLYLQVEKKARNLWRQVEEMSLTGFWGWE
jgi:hypothetical protein